MNNNKGLEALAALASASSHRNNSNDTNNSNNNSNNGSSTSEGNHASSSSIDLQSIVNLTAALQQQQQQQVSQTTINPQLLSQALSSGINPTAIATLLQGLNGMNFATNNNNNSQLDLLHFLANAGQALPSANPFVPFPNQALQMLLSGRTAAAAGRYFSYLFEISCLGERRRCVVPQVSKGSTMVHRVLDRSSSLR